MSDTLLTFNPPPGWPRPPAGWRPPKDWVPDPAWPPAPPGWQLWVHIGTHSQPPPSGILPEAAYDSPLTAPGRCTPTTPERAVEQRLAFLEAENEALRAQLESEDDGAARVIQLDDERVLQDVGIYRYHHPLETALAFRERLEVISERIATVVKAGAAIERAESFTFNGSLAQGRRMTTDLGKLMLRAYNAEAENAVRTLRVGNVVTARRRLEVARDSIARLGAMMNLCVSRAFHDLRIEEIELTADFLMKKEEEREAARRERARLREERKVELELAAERERLEKERQHIVNALEKVRARGGEDDNLSSKLTALEAAIAQNDFRAANIRAGYVYVISNRGAFGEHIVKVGLTRRLKPLERIAELGDASVPFRYDVHALYFSEDAVTLESQLHEHFLARRVNWANPRKEFFFATPADVRAILAEKVGNLLEFVEHAESTEYIQSLQYWPETHRPVLFASDKESAP